MTDEFIQHDQKPDPCEFCGIALAGDDELTDTLSFETGPTCAGGNAVGRCSAREGKRGVYDSDVGVGERGDFVKFAPYIGF